jgi:hypothetical protein
MLRHEFIQSFLGVIGLVASAPGKDSPATRRAICIQISPIAGFQYHNGEAVWGWLRPGQTLDLVRERDNPYDNKAVRADRLGHRLGYVPRTDNHAVAQWLDRGERPTARIVAPDDWRDARRRERDRKRVRLEILPET